MKTDFLQANDVRLQYFEHGTGPEVFVLVHGYQYSGRIWQLMQESLDPARFRTIAICNRGAAIPTARFRKRLTASSPLPATFMRPCRPCLSMTLP